tara:strand:- start:842 stop:1075 length:234 start_codon:yes stop_codon:yes gene_type:complete
MIDEIISMNGYGVYVWSAFIFTMISFVTLYSIIKVQLVKEQTKFNAKYSTLTSDRKKAVKAQQTYKEILVNSSVSKI